MKIAHFAIFAPHASGQYETTKDLILAERSVGINAQFIDFAYEKKMKSREGLKDSSITTAPLNWAKSADVVIRHSAVPNWVFKKKPVVLALHGRPESSFRLEFQGTAPIMSTLLSKNKKYGAYITFWPDFSFYWSRILTGERVFYIPSPIDTETYTPEGTKHDFGGKGGSPNVVIADIWRDDTTPFNLIFAAQYFKEHYCKDAKLHIYGLPAKNTAIKFLDSFYKLGLTGELYGITTKLPDIYRAADMVITPNIIATRIIRESLSSGTPIVAPHGCRFTVYTAEPRDYKAFAEAMYKCHCIKHDPMILRQEMIDKFNPTIVGSAMKKLCERVVKKATV